jgi:hypothetical protein
MYAIECISAMRSPGVKTAAGSLESHVSLPGSSSLPPTADHLQILMNTINTANCILHPSRLPEVRPPAVSSLFTSHFIPPLPKPAPQAAPLSALPAATMTVPEELPTSQASVQDFEMLEELSREMELPTSPSYAAIFELSPPPPSSYAYQEELPPDYEESHEHDTIPVAVVSEEEQEESEEEEEDDR